VFEHFLVGVANACADKRVNLWPEERVVKIGNDRVAAREDDDFFAASLRKNWAVCDRFIAECGQSVLLKSLAFCSLCFEALDTAAFLNAFGSEVWEFFLGGGTNHRIPHEWPESIHAFIGTRRTGELQLEPGKPVLLGEVADFRGFGLGWARPDAVGVWTHGRRSSLRLRVGRRLRQPRSLVLTFADACVEGDDVVTVDAAVDGRSVDTRTFARVDPRQDWRIELPRSVRSSVDVTISVRDPRSPESLGWSDDKRELGVRLRMILLEEVHEERDERDSATLDRVREKLRWILRARPRGF
jgi:hypothetical protein